MPEDKYAIPVGKIRRVNDIIDDDLRLAVSDPTLRRNIAYTYQFLDLIDWLLVGTDVDLTAREQLIKYGIVGANSIMEGIIRDYLIRSPKIEPSKGTEKNIDKSGKKKHNPVPLTIRKLLKYVHKKREKVHLHLCRGELEYHKYKKLDLMKCKEIVNYFVSWIVNV